MILMVKHAIVALSAFVGFLAALISVVAFVSVGVYDADGDDSGRRLGFSAAIIVAACVLLIVLLTGDDVPACGR